MTRPVSDLFCVSCGGPDPVFGGQCAACLTRDLVVVKGPAARVSLQRCRSCGAVPQRDSWRTPTSLQAAVESAAIASVHVLNDLEDVDIALTVEQQDEDAFVVNLGVNGTYKTVPLEGTARVEVRVHGATCPTCSRRHGGYFEATLQVRRERHEPVGEREAGMVARIIEEEVTRSGGTTGALAYLLKVEREHGGFNYFFGTAGVARSIAKRLAVQFGAKTQETATIHGRKDGRDLYRITILVRIPDTVPGSLLGYEGDVVEVLGRQGNRLLVRPVPGDTRRTLDEREVERAVVLEARAVEVIYAQADEAQVLDPDTQRTVQVKVPAGTRAGDKLQAVKYEGQWVVVGPD